MYSEVLLFPDVFDPFSTPWSITRYYFILGCSPQFQELGLRVTVLNAELSRFLSSVGSAAALKKHRDNSSLSLQFLLTFDNSMACGHCSFVLILPSVCVSLSVLFSRDPCDGTVGPPHNPG